jgi:hypothetical protein
VQRGQLAGERGVDEVVAANLMRIAGDRERDVARDRVFGAVAVGVRRRCRDRWVRDAAPAQVPTMPPRAPESSSAGSTAL